MKKRIVAVIVSLSVLCCSLSCSKRVYADPGTIIGGTILFTLAMELLGVMTGNYDGAAAVIGDVLEGLQEGAEALIDPESAFQQNWTTGASQLPPSTALFAYEQIRKTVGDWFNKGELNVEDGKFKLTYDQFHELYGQVIDVTAKPDVKFDTDYNYIFLDVDLSRSFAGSDLPLITGFYNVRGVGQAYSPVYYNEKSIVFSDTFFLFTAVEHYYFVGMCNIRSDYVRVEDYNN